MNTPVVFQGLQKSLETKRAERVQSIAGIRQSAWSLPKIVLKRVNCRHRGEGIVLLIPSFCRIAWATLGLATHALFADGTVTEGPAPTPPHPPPPDKLQRLLNSRCSSLCSHEMPLVFLCGVGFRARWIHWEPHSSRA